MLLALGARTRPNEVSFVIARLEAVWDRRPGADSHAAAVTCERFCVAERECAGKELEQVRPCYRLFLYRLASRKYDWEINT